MVPKSCSSSVYVVKIDSGSDSHCVMSPSFCDWPTCFDVVIAFDLS